MKRTVKFIPLLLVMFTAVGCRLVYAKASTSAIGKSGVGGNEESLYSKSPRPYNGLDLFVPIDKSYQFKDTFEDPLEFPSVEDIDFETASGIVDSDYVARSRNEPLPKFTRVATMKEELHINEKHDDLKFSPKDIYIERQHIMKIHSDLLWLYSRDVENFRNVYFGGEESIQHVVCEHLCYYEDGTVYNVYTYCDYDESNEAVGTFYSYFNKDENFLESEAKELFAINADSYVYYISGLGLNRVASEVEGHFKDSSSSYFAEDYSGLNHVGSVNYVRGENGQLLVVSDDNCIYSKSDLSDIPAGEESLLDSIEYHQNYTVMAFDCFSFTEDYETTSTSRATSGNVLRKETKRGRTSLEVTCATFYPDLAEYAEADDPSGLIH